MKTILIFISLTLTQLFSFSQTIFAYEDFNGFIRAFSDGTFSQIEHQAITNITPGNQMIAYQNAQKDFKIYNGIATKLITNQTVQYKVSDHLIAWNLGPNLFYYEDGKPHNISSFGGNYEVSDSLIVFQDTRFRTLNVIYKGETILLTQQTSDMYMPEIVGDNMVVFRDNGNVYKLFWRGQIFEIGVSNGFQGYEFSLGKDILAFNDPSSQTFAVFQNGEFTDVESMKSRKFKAGFNAVVYEDQQGNLKRYSNGEITELASFYQGWEYQDDVILWFEANSSYTFYDNKKTQVCNFVMKDWKLKNNIIGFRTIIGGVGAFCKGEYMEITNLSNNEYSVNGEGVMVALKNKSALVYYRGKIYSDY